jgi:hypothetical protein
MVYRRPTTFVELFHGWSIYNVDYCEYAATIHPSGVWIKAASLRTVRSMILQRVEVEKDVWEWPDTAEEVSDEQT